MKKSEKRETRRRLNVNAPGAWNKNACLCPRLCEVHRLRPVGFTIRRSVPSGHLTCGAMFLPRKSNALYNCLKAVCDGCLEPIGAIGIIEPIWAGAIDIFDLNAKITVEIISNTRAKTQA